MSHGNSTLARLARPHAEHAIQRLIAILDNCYQPAAARVAAARALIEFAYGWPAQRLISKSAATPVEKVVKVEWGNPAT